MTLKVSIRAFLSVTLGLTSSQRRENTSWVSWDVRECSVRRFPGNSPFLWQSQQAHMEFCCPVFRQKKVTTRKLDF